MDIDAFAPRLSFFWGIGMNFYMVSTLLLVFFSPLFFVTNIIFISTRVTSSRF